MNPFSKKPIVNLPRQENASSHANPELLTTVEHDRLPRLDGAEMNLRQVLAYNPDLIDAPTPEPSRPVEREATAPVVETEAQPTAPVLSLADIRAQVRAASQTSEEGASDERTAA